MVARHFSNDEFGNNHPRFSEYLPHPCLADPWPAQRRLQRSKHIRPLYQGEYCPGLAGLYALLNAIRLALPTSRQLTTREVDMLFRAGLRFLEVRGSLCPSLTGGMRLTALQRLADTLQFVAQRHLGVLLWIDQPFRHGPNPSLAETLLVLETLVVKQQPALMLRRGGAYTIICGFTPNSLLLFDSFGGRWIRRPSCGIVGLQPWARHQFLPASLMTFSARAFGIAPSQSAWAQSGQR